MNPKPQPGIDPEEHQRIDSIVQAGNLRIRFLNGQLDILPDLIGRLEALTHEVTQGGEIRMGRAGLSVTEELRILRSYAEPADARQTLLELMAEAESIRGRALAGDLEAIRSLRPEPFARGRMDVAGESVLGDLVIFEHDKLAFIADRIADSEPISPVIISQGDDLMGHNMRGWLNPIITLSRKNEVPVTIRIDGRETGPELMGNLTDRLVSVGALWLGPDSPQLRRGAPSQLFERFRERAFYLLLCAFWPFAMIALSRWPAGGFGSGMRSAGSAGFVVLWIVLGLPTTARLLIRNAYYSKRLGAVDFGWILLGAPLITFAAFFVVGAPVVSLIDLIFDLGFFWE